MVGVPGTRFIEMQGMTPGKGILHILLGRPWEVEAAFTKDEVYEPVGDIKIEITVREPTEKKSIETLG